MQQVWLHLQEFNIIAWNNQKTFFADITRYFKKAIHYNIYSKKLLGAALTIYIIFKIIIISDTIKTKQKSKPASE